MQDRRFRPTLSIVLPVFAVERYIGRCAESIAKQAYSDFEVVLVDDRTPDRSIDIASTIFRRGDVRFHVVRHEHNSGVGISRQTGLSASGGNWIWFLDPDDEVADGAIPRVLSLIATAPRDSYIYATRREIIDEQSRVMRIEDRQRVPSGRMGVDKLVSAYVHETITRSMVDKVFERDFLKKWTLSDHRTAEDMETLIVNAELDPFVFAVDFALYRYRIREGSLSDRMAHEELRVAGVARDTPMASLVRQVVRDRREAESLATYLATSRVIRGGLGRLAVTLRDSRSFRQFAPRMRTALDAYHLSDVWDYLRTGGCSKRALVAMGAKALGPWASGVAWIGRTALLKEFGYRS